MELRPRRTLTSPEYPARRSQAGGLLRLAAAAGASAVLAAAGCTAPHRLAGTPMSDHHETTEQVSTEGQAEASEAEGDGSDKQASRPAPRGLAVCQPDARLSGDLMAVSHFTCAPSVAPSMPVHDAPLHWGQGRFCGNGGAGWARVRVTAPLRVRIQTDDPRLRLVLHAPDGSRVAELSGRQGCVTLEMEPGIWVIEATDTNPSGPPRTGFEFLFSPSP